MDMAVAESGEKVDRFRPVEKKYRHKGDGHKNARQRRHEKHLNIAGLDYSNVIDVHNIEHNTEENRSRIHQVDITQQDVAEFNILDPRNAKLFEIDGLSGLRILTNAMPFSIQAQWALRAVREYSKNPFTNISNLLNDRNATKDLWEDAWRNRTDETWKNFHSLRWANVGRHYDWTAREYLDTPDMPPLPIELKHFVAEVYKLTNMTSCKLGESGIVNFYPAGTMMGGHLDNAEEDMVNPIVSLSLGTQCIYLQGGFTRDVVPTPIWLRSGDIVIMGGEARRCFHGVPLVTTTQSNEFMKAVEELSSTDSTLNPLEVESFLEYISRARININLRRVQNSG